MSLIDDIETPMFICKPRSCNVVWVKENARVGMLLENSRKIFANKFKSIHGRYPGIKDIELMNFLDLEEKRIRRRLGDNDRSLKIISGKGQKRLF